MYLWTFHISNGWMNEKNETSKSLINWIAIITTTQKHHSTNIFKLNFKQNSLIVIEKEREWIENVCVSECVCIHHDQIGNSIWWVMLCVECVVCIEPLVVWWLCKQITNCYGKAGFGAHTTAQTSSSYPHKLETRAKQPASTTHSLQIPYNFLIYKKIVIFSH